MSMLMLTCGYFCLPVSPIHGAGYSPRIGQPHPDFILPDIVEGRPISLSQFRGRKVLLIHMASW